MASRYQNYRRTPKAARTLGTITFDSKGEMLRYAYLQQMQAAALITGLTRQVTYPLMLPNGVPVRTPTGRTATYTADFTYTVCASGEKVVEDFKGTDDDTKRLRRAVVEAIYGFKIRLTKKYNAGL